MLCPPVWEDTYHFQTPLVPLGRAYLCGAMPCLSSGDLRNFPWDGKCCIGNCLNAAAVKCWKEEETGFACLDLPGCQYKKWQGEKSCVKAVYVFCKMKTSST